MEFNISALYLNALMPFLKKLEKSGDKRQYMNCLQVRTKENSVELLVTDGHWMARLKLRAQVITGCTEWRGIPAKDLVGLKFPDTDLLSFDFLFDSTPSKAHTCTISTGQKSSTIGACNQQRPCFERLITTGELSGVPAPLNIEYLSLFAQSWRILTKTKSRHKPPQVNIEFNGEGNAARIQFYGRDDFVGVLMPYKLEEK